MHTRCSCIRSCIIPYRLASPQGFGKPLLILPVAKGRNQRVQHNHKAQAGGGSGQSEAPSPSPSSPPPQQAQQPFGQLLALAAVGVGAAAFILSRFSSGAPNLSSLEKTAVPFDTALANGKPSLLEFYANWCETCRESAPDVYKAERAVKDKVNLVMLNIDNPKWSPEAAQYRVRGIPHFVFLDGRGRQLGNAVGRFPESVLNENVEALANGVPLPFTKAAGASSPLTQRSQQPQHQQIAPRSHSAS